MMQIKSTLCIFLFVIIILSIYPKSSLATFDVDISNIPNTTPSKQTSDLVSFPYSFNVDQLRRYIVFGSGHIQNILSQYDNVIYGVDSDKSSIAVGIFDNEAVSNFKLHGYNVIEDLPLEFDSNVQNTPVTEISKVSKILGSDQVFHKYRFNGNNIRIGIVDTGTDFSNPDISNSIARDKNNFPIMIDTDGQGIVLTNATFIANISNKGIIQNYTKPIPKNITSSVYVTSTGVFLNLHGHGKGTNVKVYNSLYPKGGSIILNGTVSNDYKIGKDSKHFIMSKSGVYHFGIIYENISYGQLFRLQLVPVLVVDSIIPGFYDTIIPDMSDSWKDFTNRNNFISTKFDFDFTDEQTRTLGDGNENLVYDSKNDGKLDYSAGTLGSHVLDVFGVISKPSKLDKKLGAINGTLLPPIDSHGNFFGVMYDSEGHGTATASSIISQGKQEYDIYSNSTTYHILGVAPGAKIVPIKSLWLGDAIYGWLWASGFDLDQNHWKYHGNRVDIISNSWGISTFPTLQSAPGLDFQSILLNELSIPRSLDTNYPGILVVNSAGNAGPGYGTIGTPDAAPFAITVGSVTDNVFIGHGSFKNQPRFGNYTSHFGEISGFSSKGPTILGDPKPELMAVGEYSYTPTSVTRFNKNSNGFGLFGGTSLAAPLVAGSAAILMQSLRENHIPYNPFAIKNILMSTATDLGNDPFSQGSGLVNVTRAVDFALGNNGVFEVYNDASYVNTKKILNSAIKQVNSSSFGLQHMILANTSFPETPWFAGRLHPGDRTSATFTIVNPTNETLGVYIEPEKLGLIKTDTYNGTTQLRLHDPLVQKSDIYRPNYISLDEVKSYTGLGSFFDKSNSIPKDSSLLVLDLTYPFSQFMNSSSKTYADDMKISSLYFYDWPKKNATSAPTYKEISLINRAGSWGTMQELRVSYPYEKIKHTPLVGIYPVPTRFSYWNGDTKKNSTSLDYTLSANYYKRTHWDEVWLNSNHVNILPHSNIKIKTTLIVPPNKNPGIYQYFINFKGNLHQVEVPVTYVVLKKLQPKDLPTVISGQYGDSLFGNGYTSGGFDMANRYNAGDWRQYYFDVNDSTINSVSMNVSWKDPSTNLSVFVIDPHGKIIQTNNPSGAFGELQGWPSSDWLGPSTPFSEGGGFYPSKNKDSTSTILYAPINETGVYSVLTHTTLFGASRLTEPVTITTKFSTILPIETSPEVMIDIPIFINNTFHFDPKITGDAIQQKTFSIDDDISQSITTSNLSNSLHHLSEGEHHITFVISDSVGHTSIRDFKFILDNTAPDILIKSPSNHSKISGSLNINLDVSDSNLASNNWLKVSIDNQTFHDQNNILYNTTNLADGDHTITIKANDRSGNQKTENIIISVDNSKSTHPSNNGDQNYILSLMLIGVGIMSFVIALTIKKLKNSKQS